MLRKKALALLSALVIQGCADPLTQPPGTSIQLEKLPRVDNSRSSPCWQQEQIAAQNSYISTLQAGGKETVFKAPCVAEPKKIARAK
jgi:hypothetical protein